jgi:hypothetical protein
MFLYQFYVDVKFLWLIHAMPERIQILFPFGENDASVEILKVDISVSVLNRVPCAATVNC